MASLTLVAMLCPVATAAAQAPQLLGAQATFIDQHLAPFHAPYSGPRSLDSTGDTKATDTYGIYGGARLAPRLQAYADIEMARGAGVSHAMGLGGITNGDVIRQGSANLGQGPYVARVYLRYLVPLGTGDCFRTPRGTLRRTRGVTPGERWSPGCTRGGGSASAALRCRAWPTATSSTASRAPGAITSN